MVIPAGKTTAIVGTSGSGKTTLIKLILGFYTPTQGNIYIDGVPIACYNLRQWRLSCGVVMQDGYIFSDLIKNNIGVAEDSIDTNAVCQAAKLANLQDFVESLPLGYETKIGNDGLGLSQGQKQRILIARSIYKKPNYLFFDEATNSLDAENEKLIIGNLDAFCAGKTMVVVAHRLSTVRNAHQIIVLDKGRIVEQGTHEQLIRLQGKYYNLVRNQLELGL